MYYSIVNDNGTIVSVDKRVAKLLNKKFKDIKPQYIQFRNSIQNCATGEREILDNDTRVVAQVVSQL